MKKWLFVCGPPRTGTTITQQVLNLFPDTKVLYETNIATNIKTRLTYSPDVNEGGGIDNIWKYPQKSINDGCYDIICTMRNWFGDPKWFGDKHPIYSSEKYWRIVDEIFGKDEVKWILLSRDLEESAMSLSKCRTELTLDYCRQVIKWHYIGLDALKKEHTDILEIEHQQIQDNPKEIVINMANFLELQLDDETIDKAVDLIDNGCIHRCISFNNDIEYKYYMEYK